MAAGEPSSAGGAEERRRLLERLLAARGVGRPRAADAFPLGRRPPEADPVPLYPNQEGLWFVDRLHPRNGYFNIPGTVRLRGPLDAPRLEAALRAVLARHEALRTVYRVTPAGPVQVVKPVPASVLMLEDLSDALPGEREARALRRAEEEARRGFDLEEGPLFRAHLLRLGPEDHVFLVNFHHSAADGWSVDIFTRELEAAYTALGAGETFAAPAPLQYGDFVWWFRRRWEQGDLEAQRRWWAERLAQPPPDLELPTDRPRPAAPHFEGRHQPLVLGAGLTRSVRELAGRERVSVYHVLLSAFAVTVRHLAGQDAFCVGSTFANRVRPELEHVVGFFANTLPVPLDLEGDPTFRELLLRVRDAVLGAFEHQEVPFAALVRELRPGRRPGTNPFYRVVFDLLTPDRNPAVYGYGLASVVPEQRRFAGLRVEPMDVEGGVARFDLAVFLWDLGKQLCGTVEFRTDLFEEATVGRMFRLFRQAVAAGARDPGQPLSALCALLEAASRREEAAEAVGFRERLRERLRRRGEARRT